MGAGQNVIFDLSGNQSGVYMRYLIYSLRFHCLCIYENNDHSRRVAGQPFSVR